MIVVFFSRVLRLIMSTLRRSVLAHLFIGAARLSAALCSHDSARFLINLTAHYAPLCISRDNGHIIKVLCVCVIYRIEKERDGGLCWTIRTDLTQKGDQSTHTPGYNGDELNGRSLTIVSILCVCVFQPEEKVRRF